MNDTSILEDMLEIKRLADEILCIGEKFIEEHKEEDDDETSGTL